MNLKHVYYLETLFNILFHSTILFGALSILFWIYIKNVERRIILREVKYNIHLT